jgi:hypothetical protein
MTQKTYTLQQFIDFLRDNPNLQVQGSESSYIIGLVKFPKGKDDIYYECNSGNYKCNSEQMLWALNNNHARSDLLYTNLRKLMDRHELREKLSII